MTERPEKSLWRRCLPDSLHGQLILALLIGIPMLQGINMYTVYIIQRSYVQRTELIRAENIAAHYFLLEGMTPEQRAEAVGRVSKAHRSEEHPELLELFSGPEAMEPDESLQETQQLRLVRASLEGYAYEPQVVARLYENTADHPKLPKNIGLVKIAIRFPDGSWMAVS